VDLDNGFTPCTEAVTDFTITFTDSVSGASQSYDVSIPGTVLDPVYSGTFQLTEFLTYLSPPCTLSTGYLSIVGTSTPECDFFWSLTAFPDGSGSYTIVDDTPSIYTPTLEYAFCLGGACPQPADSVTISPSTSFPDVYNLNWWQPAGFVRIWTSTDVNAVFPATYTELASGYLPEGSYNFFDFFFSPDPQLRVVLTIDCTFFLRAPGDEDTPVSGLQSPFLLPTRIQR
jgi:hypothetical protein